MEEKPGTPNCLPSATVRETQSPPPILEQRRQTPGPELTSSRPAPCKAASSPSLADQT